MVFWTADCADYADYQQTTDLTDCAKLLMRKRMNFNDCLPQESRKKHKFHNLKSNWRLIDDNCLPIIYHSCFFQDNLRQFGSIMRQSRFFPNNKTCFWERKDARPCVSTCQQIVTRQKFCLLSPTMSTCRKPWPNWSGLFRYELAKHFCLFVCYFVSSRNFTYFCTKFVRTNPRRKAAPPT